MDGAVDSLSISSSAAFAYLAIYLVLPIPSNKFSKRCGRYDLWALLVRSVLHQPQKMLRGDIAMER